MKVDPLLVQNAECFYVRPAQPVARGQHVAHSDISNEKTFFVNFPLAQPRQNAQVSLKTYEIFIYGYIHYVTNSNCKKINCILYMLPVIINIFY